MATDDVDAAAAERKERLRALRAAVELSTAAPLEEEQEQRQINDDAVQATQQNGETEQEREKELRFRNYMPRNEELQKNRKEAPKLPKFDDPIAKDPSDITRTEDPIVSIAPKKANWDLRRDVAKKLEKLERRTQRAIIELMQEEKRRQALIEDGEE
ncbi:hypothetical protein O6H91_02G031700 [Diphasiastrum complanatum]|uniref:Uncharacterized protein n=1 Tax=Diphasiastrum complanatum TaxID=34168 RepID=A0ACC2EE31_DIPCM|nr:hypothetical protein O6H91_02G031700 [Diphasiastrum complanatum]